MPEIPLVDRYGFPTWPKQCKLFLSFVVGFELCLQSSRIRRNCERERIFGCDVLLRYGIQRHLLQMCHGKEYQTHGNSSESESCSVPEIKIAFLASMLGDLRHTWMSKRDQHLTCEIFDVPIVVFQRNSTAQIMAR